MFMRYLLTVCYNGEKFCGWQKQKIGVSIQGEIETALETLLKEKIDVVGSGRTDASVNAIGQKAHFETEKEIKNLSKFLYSLNGILDNDIKVLEIISSNVHARFSAKKKTYLYKLYQSSYELPYKFKSLRIDDKCNVKLIKKYAKLLIGEKDFKNFACTGSSTETTVRKIYSIKFKQNKQDIDVYITGNGFLYKMVRNIIGLLIEAGNKNMDKSSFLAFAFGDKAIKKTASPYALFLYNVDY